MSLAQMRCNRGTGRVCGQVGDSCFEKSRHRRTHPCCSVVISEREKLPVHRIHRSAECSAFAFLPTATVWVTCGDQAFSQQEAFMGLSRRFCPNSDRLNLAGLESGDGHAIRPTFKCDPVGLKKSHESLPGFDATYSRPRRRKV